MGGLIRYMPHTALYFLVGALAISALPPLNGFISEWLTFQASLQAPLLESSVVRSLVPIVPDESRTFGMEGLFRQIGIYAHTGQLYEPVDSDVIGSLTRIRCSPPVKSRSRRECSRSIAS